jgi:hypothetical protein
VALSIVLYVGTGLAYSSMVLMNLGCLDSMAFAAIHQLMTIDHLLELFSVETVQLRLPEFS